MLTSLVTQRINTFNLDFFFHSILLVSSQSPILKYLIIQRILHMFVISSSLSWNWGTARHKNFLNTWLGLGLELELLMMLMLVVVEKSSKSKSSWSWWECCRCQASLFLIAVSCSHPNIYQHLRMYLVPLTQCERHINLDSSIWISKNSPAPAQALTWRISTHHSDK